MQIPDEAVQPRRAGGRPLRPDPPARHVALVGEGPLRVGAGEAAHQLVLRIENLQGDFRLRVEEVIDDGAVGRVCAHRLVGRERRIGIGIPAHPQCKLRLEEVTLCGRRLAQRLNVVEDPEPAPVGRDREVVALDDQIANRGRGHVQSQGFPMPAIVEGNEYALLGAGIEQAFAQRIFANHVDHGPRGGQSQGDRIPMLSAVVSTEDLRLQDIEPQRIDRRIGRLRVEMSGLQNRDLCPGNELRRRHLAPALSAVAGEMDKPIVGACPDQPGRLG